MDVFSFQIFFILSNFIKDILVYKAFRLIFSVVAQIVNVLKVFHINIDILLYRGVMTLFVCLFVYLFAMPCGMQILVPRPGIEPMPPQWKCGVLTAGPPGNSLSTFFCACALFHRLESFL